jgi:hypothetical protein
MAPLLDDAADFIDEVAAVDKHQQAVFDVDANVILCKLLQFYDVVESMQKKERALLLLRLLATLGLLTFKKWRTTR